MLINTQAMWYMFDDVGSAAGDINTDLVASTLESTENTNQNTINTINTINGTGNVWCLSVYR